MSKAPDWRKQRNSHFLPRQGPVHCGCQPAERQRRSCCGSGFWSCSPPLAMPWPPGVPLEPWSYSVAFWGYTLCLYTMQRTFSSLKALRSPPPLGGVSQFSFGLNRGRSPTCGDPCPSRVFLPSSLLTSQPFPSIPMATAPRPSSASLVSLLYFCTFRTTTITLRSPPLSTEDHRSLPLPAPQPKPNGNC